MSSEISAVILAGGLGSRMGRLTDETHKSMLEVDGKPVIGHILDGLQKEFGSARVILTTGHKGEQIRERFGSKYRNIDLEYVHSPDHLEVRKRLLLADGLINGPFFVMGSDVIAHSSQQAHMASTFDANSGDIYGVISGGVDLQPAPTHALIFTEGNNVTEIQTYPPFHTDGRTPLRDMSLWYFDQKVMHVLKNAPDMELNISPVLNEGIKHGADYLIERYFDEWYHFGTPEDLQSHINFRRDNI